MEAKDKSGCQEQLNELRKEFEEFSYILSHDLKAPVRAISNLSVWIEEDLGESIPADVLQNMNLLRSRANRLELMIDALLRYSRVSTVQLEQESTAVKDLMETAAESISGIQALTLLTPDELPVFTTYKEKLQFIIAEIARNTAFFGRHEKLTLTLTVTQKEEFYFFDFADNGGGVPEEALVKLFKLFYTVSPKDAVNTTGAGLTIAKRMVQYAGGDMWAQNNLQGGLSIMFSWPK